LACGKLADAVQTDLVWLRKHTEMSENARIWELGGRHRGLLIRSPALQAAEKWRASRPNGAPKLTALQEQYIVASRKGLRQRLAVRIVASLAALVAAVFLASNIGFLLWMTNPDNRKNTLQVLTQSLINYSRKEERLPKITALISELEADHERNPDSPDINSRLREAYETATGTYYEMNDRYSAAKARRRQYDLILPIYEKLKDGTILEQAAATEQLLFASINAADAYAAVNDNRADNFYSQAIQLFESEQKLNRESAAADLAIVRGYAHKAMHATGSADSQAAAKVAALDAIQAIDKAVKRKAELIAPTNGASDPGRSRKRSFIETSLNAYRGLAFASLGSVQRQQNERQLALATFEKAKEAFDGANNDEFKAMSETWLPFIQNLITELKSN
jgi:hypothetical protein